MYHKFFIRMKTNKMGLGKFFKWVKNAAGKVGNAVKTVGKKIIVPLAKGALKAAPAIGAAVGSIVPGIGTAAGTAIGTALTGVSKAAGII